MSPRTTWRAQPHPLERPGLAAGLVLAGLGAGLARLALSLPLGAGAMLALVLALLVVVGGGVLAGLAWGARTLSYRLEAGRLTIRWLWWCVEVPYGAVDGVFSGARLGAEPGPRFLSVGGYRVGMSAGSSDRPIYYYTTTQQLERLSLISTESGLFVLSPSDSAAFRRELIERLEAHTEAPSGLRPWTRPWFFKPFQDPLAASCLGLSLGLLLVGLGLVLDRYPALPDRLAFQVEPSGQVLASGPREHVVWLPVTAGFGAVVNALVGCAVARREPILGRLLWLSAPLLQLLALMSVVRVLP